MHEMSPNSGTASERSRVMYGDYAGAKPLPTFRPVKFPPPPDQIPLNPGIIAESCGGKIISGGFIGAHVSMQYICRQSLQLYVCVGGFLGIGMGLFMGMMGGDTLSNVALWKGKEVPTAPLREQLRSGTKATLGKMTGWAKQFAVLTALFGGVECVIEKYRAKHDVWNAVASGCVVGATLSASGGPQVSLFSGLFHDDMLM